MKHKCSKWAVRLLLYTVGLITIFVTIFLFFYIFWKGRTVISLEFLTESPGGMPFGTDGGIYPALVGSLMLGALAAALGGGIGIFCALYLSFGKQKSWFYQLVKWSVLSLSGIPSIIFGLVSYTFLIYKLGMKRCLLTAGITVSIMILPFVAIRAKKIFDEAGALLMKQSLTLGMSPMYAIRKFIFPQCIPQLLSTVALGMAYGMGAVAPILYTGVVMQAGIPQNLFRPFMSLPYHLYMLVNNGFSLEYAYGTAFVLMALLLLIQLICKGISFKKKPS